MKAPEFVILLLYAFATGVATQEGSLKKGRSPPVPERLIADLRPDLAVKKPFLRWKNPKRMERIVYAEPLNSKVRNQYLGLLLIGKDGLFLKRPTSRTNNLSNIKKNLLQNR